MEIKKAIIGMFSLKEFFLVDIYFCVKLRGAGRSFLSVKSLILTKRNIPDEGNEMLLWSSLFLRTVKCWKVVPSFYLSLNLHMVCFTFTKMKIQIHRTNVTSCVIWIYNKMNFQIATFRNAATAKWELLSRGEKEKKGEEEKLAEAVFTQAK